MKKPKFHYFADVKAVLAEKDRLYDVDRRRREKDLMVRSFYNGQSLKTYDAAQREDSPEVVNHLMGYSNLLRLVDGVFSIYSTTDTLIEIEVNTGSPEVDITAGGYLTRYINDAVYHSGKFEHVWSSFSGESGLAGRGPLTFSKRGWCPKLAPNMLLPENSSSVPDEITYAHAPHELNYAALKRLEQSVKSSDGESKFIDLPTVKLLLQALEEQIRGEGMQTSTATGKELSADPQNQTLWNETRTTIKAWKYFEVYFHETKKHLVVSSTLIAEGVNLLKDKNFEGEAKIVSHIPIAYETPNAWLHTMIVDSQIGGVKTFGTARGIAELTYNSDTDAEELLAENIAGAKIRARPKFQMDQNANRRQVEEWNVEKDSVVPMGVTSVQMYAGHEGLLMPLSLLNQTSSALTGGGFSNTGRDTGELRQQAVERQSRNASMANNRMSAVYTAADRLVREIVRRFLLADAPAGSEDYDDIAWVRDCLEEKKIPYKELAKMKFGRFKYLKVRIARSIGQGDRESELAVADALMEHIAEFEPEVRPLIRRKWVTLITRDPALAERLAALPELVINSQKLVAENEFDTITRRASLGQVLPVATDDIDEDHMPVHLIDTQALLAESMFRSFTKLDLSKYAGMVDHMNQHLQRMAAVPASAGAAKAFQQQLQRLTAAAQPIIAQVQEQEEAAQTMGMSAKEQADFLLKQASLNLTAQKHGLDVAKYEANEVQRRQREHRADRQQYATETQQEKQNRLAKEKLELEKQKAKDAKSKAKKPAAKGA